MLTHHLPDGRWIETSADQRGGVLRLRARLVDANGLVVEVLRRDYPASDPNAKADFTAEWERLTGVTINRPLFSTLERLVA